VACSAGAEGVRVNKCFRATASRREADRLVASWRVTVNGVRATAGQLVRPGDKVKLDSKLVRWESLQVDLLDDERAASPTLPSSAPPPSGRRTGQASSVPLPLEASFTYLKYHKPAGVVCSMASDADALSAQPVARACRQRLFTVGRLDKESTGLLLLTSDGRVPNAVLRPAHGHEKAYRVVTDVRVSDADVARLAAGVVITTVAQRDGNRAVPLTAPTKPCVVSREADRSLLFTLQEGRNRQLRRMLGALGYSVVSLHRTRFLSISLGSLAPGCWELLSEAEMRDVRAAVRQAGGGGTG